MSRHYLKTICKGEGVRVVCGWDHHRHSFFMYIDRAKPQKNEDEFLFNSYKLPSENGKSFDYFLQALKRFGITLPDEMIKEVIADGEEDINNKDVIHKYNGGVTPQYERKVV